ncbi:MAG: HNH endonuclease signature motif containing protein, partial [Pseudorhodobacter sp.]|nr:HNH endonuclease signature motif containing protein [Pseudorhodobacter sp.]
RLIFPIVSTHNTPAAPVQKRDCCTTGVVSFGRCSTPSAGHFCTLFYSQIVKRHIQAIFDYCEAHDASEFVRLQDPRFSKEIFDINYPFCIPVSKISQADLVRYWRDEYSVHGVPVKVTSQWFNPPTSKSLTLFRRYLQERGILFSESQDTAPETVDETQVDAIERAARGRYKGNAIGNAQNYLVRNILSRLGDEQFSASQWEAVIADFGNSCAYCGAADDLVMDHVVPINKQALGEHRIGNLVPACRSCNAKKAERDFRVFLSHDRPRSLAIEAHMAKHAYVPIGENETLRQIIELAHQDLRYLADRYVKIINTVLGEGKGDLG